MKLFITHAKWSSPDHFEALGCEDTHPNMMIRFDFTTENGWRKWRHGGWLPINLNEVPENVMARYEAAKPRERELEMLLHSVESKTGGALISQMQQPG